MRIHYFCKEHLRTNFIQIDSRKCNACWKCIENCPKHVLEKVDIVIHRHSHIYNSNECIGCLKCIKTCEFNAISKIHTTYKINNYETRHNKATV